MIARKTNAANKANAEAKVTTALLPSTVFTVVVKRAGEARSAALFFCYSVTAYLLNVCHMQETGSKERLTLDEALKYITKEIGTQAGVKGGMLDHYIRTGRELYSKLIGVGQKPTTLGAPVVKLMADATNAEKSVENIIDHISVMMEKNAGVGSFRDLSKTLGFKSFATPAGGGAQKLTTVKASERITNAITAVAKAAKDGKVKGGITPTAMARDVVSAVADPLVLAKAAIDKALSVTTDPDAIHELIAYIQKQVDALEARMEADAKQAKAEKAKAKPKKGKVMPPKTPTAHTVQALHAPSV
jgi:hypothetical protein